MIANRYLTEAERFRAWEERDLGAVGAFVGAVRSTGIYCRVGCPARSPKRENLRFFDTPEAAEAAGYRACLRCRPREALASKTLVHRLKTLIEQAEKPPTLAELGQAVGLSPFHLQRLFKQETGLSPKQYAQAFRLGKLKEQLRMNDTVTQAMYEAGYGSSNSLYHQANTQMGMTPLAYRRGGKGLKIRFVFADSPLGKLIIGATEKGVCSILIGDSEAGLLALLRQEFAEAELEPGQLAEFVEPILAQIAGKPVPDLPLDLHGTAFQLRVWEALRSIPRGQTRSYGQLARALGDPKAVRAVAGACGANPVAIVVPCHRVIGADGKLTGYRWGVQRKHKLLEQEGAALRERQPVLI